LGIRWGIKMDKFGARYRIRMGIDENGIVIIFEIQVTWIVFWATRMVQ
jgi:hypothetical protein